MALNTIAEADLYSVNDVYAGIVDEVIKASPLLAFLPFQDVQGNALQYLRESTLPDGAFYDPGDTWTESTPTAAQQTQALKIFGNDADVDEFLRATRSNYTDLRAETIAKSVKGMGLTFESKLIYGNDSTDPKEFDGLHVLCASGGSQALAAGSGTAGGPFTFTLLDQLLDLCKPKADVIMLGRRAKRGMQKLARSQGWDLALSDPGLPGINRPIHFYSDVPLVVSDALTITEDVVDGEFDDGGTDDTESIFALRFAEDGFHGIQSGPMHVEEVGTLESKDARRDRIKWYAAPVLKSTLSVAKISGGDDQAWTN